MTPSEALNLKAGYRVEIWQGTASASKGTISATGRDFFDVEWDDGEFGSIHIQDATDVIILS